MPRRNRRATSRGRSGRGGMREPRPLPRDGAAFLGAQSVPGPRWSHGEPYIMRHIGSSRATKYYVCPGCNNNIPPGVVHIVAWPRDTGRQEDDRRHWHRHCWERR